MALAQKPDQSGVVLVGVERAPFQDLYHAVLRLSWTGALLVIVGTYLSVNALFGLAYFFTGGVAGANGGYLDAFFFSVETMGTIGYGEMHPASTAAHSLVVLESVTGLTITALATGLVFAKFSLPLARIVFSRQAVIAPMNGVPTLMMRVGNARQSIIAEATVRVAMVRTELTDEGTTFYRLVDLPLSRERSPALARSWTVLHPIDDKSPLYKATPNTLEKDEVEIMVSVVGTDDTSLQPVHARHRYFDKDILWGARHVDVLSFREDGMMVLDVSKFHETTATKPTAFPFPKSEE